MCLLRGLVCMLGRMSPAGKRKREIDKERESYVSTAWFGVYDGPDVACRKRQREIEQERGRVKAKEREI